MPVADGLTAVHLEPRKEFVYEGTGRSVSSKAVFQTGMSWKVVEAKWPGIREAFRGFDPAAVTALTPDDLDALTKDTRVIRNRRKIEAIVHNARQMLEAERRTGALRQAQANGNSCTGVSNGDQTQALCGGLPRCGISSVR